jgi:hypothetical protein
MSWNIFIIELLFDLYLIVSTYKIIYALFFSWFIISNKLVLAKQLKTLKILLKYIIYYIILVFYYI